MTRGRSDDGAAAVGLLLLTPALLGLAGLVLDGGRQLAARQQAADLAEQAARAGADHLDVSALRATGTAGLNAAAVRAAACGYVSTADPTATCTATVIASPAGQQVQVQVRTSAPTVLLTLIGVQRLHTDATGTATAVTGIRSTLGRQP
jgi:Flp pilus assembly protein TadG